MKTHHAHSLKKLPDPFLFDSIKLLAELQRIRGLVLQLPVINLDNHGAVNTVVDAVWRLENDLRFLLSLHKDGQRAFAKRSQIEAEQPEKHRVQVEPEVHRKVVRM